MISWVKVLLFLTCRENLTHPSRPPARVIPEASAVLSVASARTDREAGISGQSQNPSAACTAPLPGFQLIIHHIPVEGNITQECKVVGTAAIWD